MEIVFLSREEKPLLRLRNVIFENKPRAIAPKVKRIASTRDPWFALNIRFKVARLSPAIAATTVTGYIAASLVGERSGPQPGPEDEIGLVLKSAQQTYSISVMTGAIADARRVLEQTFVELAGGLSVEGPAANPEAESAIPPGFG